MKIAIFSPKYPGIGGMEEHVDVLKKTLENQGHHVTVLTSNRVYHYTKSSMLAQIIGNLFFQIKFLFIPLEYDIVNIQSGAWGLLFYPIKKNKAKIIYTSHHTYYQHVKYMNQWYKYPLMLIEVLIYKYADLILTVSLSTKKVLIHNYKLSKNNIQILFNPVKELKKEIIDVKRESGTILFIGRFDKRKNPVLLIKMMKELICTNKKFKLFMIWNGKLKKLCEQKIQKENLGENIKLLGNVTELEKTYFMYLCEYLIIPSIFEWQWIVYLEWIRHGMKVLCNNCDGLNDMCPRENIFNSWEELLNLIKNGKYKKDLASLNNYLYEDYTNQVNNIFRNNNK